MGVTYDLSGKTAVVTGGGKGIGRAIAAQLKTSGSQVWAWDIAPTAHDGIDSLAVDVTNSDQVAAAVAHILDQNSRIDIVVNNAGYLGGYLPFEQLPREQWHRIMEVNLVGVLEVCRHVLPHMRRAGWNGSSTWARSPESTGWPKCRSTRLPARE